MFNVYLLYFQYGYVYDVISIISFHSHINPDQWFRAIFYLIVSQRMSPMRSGYREFGLELVSFGEYHSRHPKHAPMAEEKRDNVVGYPIK